MTGVVVANKMSAWTYNVQSYSEYTVMERVSPAPTDELQRLLHHYRDIVKHEAVHIRSIKMVPKLTTIHRD
jgi:hypothetical protein